MLRRWWKLALLVAAGAVLVWLRVAIVEAWFKPAGDGVQYFNLAAELRAHGRFAFGPSLPLSYSRLPGYPLFMFLVSPRPIGMGTHIWRAVHWNVAFDTATALLLLFAARAAGLRRAWTAALFVLALPTLWLMSCYAMTESLSMFLVAAIAFCAVVTLERGRWSTAIAMGVAAGLAQLVRLDALCAWPIIFCACWRAPVEPRRRWQLLGASLAAALAVFSPWPIRNLVHFGAPHPAATTWRADDGTPLRTGPVMWARTWADSSQGAFFELYFVYQRPYEIDRPGAIPPGSFDDDAERRRLVGILQDYNRERLSEGVNDEFLALARDRLRRRPLHVLVGLPLARIKALFAAEPEYEMPMRVEWLKLPDRRAWLIRCDRVLFALALLGVVLSWRRRRRLVWLFAPAILFRVALYSMAIPQATTERYLVEAFPLFILFAVAALTAVEERVRRSPPP
jgi:hypothetical protein